jgi:hypothetical protein
MSVYQTFTPVRTTPLNPGDVLQRIRAVDPTAGLYVATDGTVTVKKATDWTANQIAQVQTLLDTAPANTPQLQAQIEVDTWPLSVRALVLTLIDQLNTLRAFHGLPAVTPAQALAAVRAKAGTL